MDPWALLRRSPAPRSSIFSLRASAITAWVICRRYRYQIRVEADANKIIARRDRSRAMVDPKDIEQRISQYPQQRGIVPYLQMGNRVVHPGKAESVRPVAQYRAVRQNPAWLRLLPALQWATRKHFSGQKSGQRPELHRLQHSAHDMHAAIRFRRL